MTPAFFRRWLRRSQQAVTTNTSASMQATKEAAMNHPAHGEPIPDQYEVYIKALQAKYSDPVALQEVS